MNFYYNYFSSIGREHINCHCHCHACILCLFLKKVVWGIGGVARFGIA